MIPRKVIGRLREPLLEPERERARRLRAERGLYLRRTGSRRGTDHPLWPGRSRHRFRHGAARRGAGGHGRGCVRGRSISVEHSTVYRYDCAVDLEPHTFRLRPRMTTTQRLLAFDLQIVPAPAGSAESLDQDGNLALNAWFNAPAFELNVSSRFRVELLRDNPFDFTCPPDRSGFRCGTRPRWPNLLPPTETT